MTPEQWQRITELYHSAAEMQGRERDEFLDRVCRDDASLRREIETLLAADAAAGDFISTPAVGAIESWSGQFVAHYQIMSRIGSGGMGEVYLAKDSKLNRLVALKTLPAVLSGHPDHLLRFEKEAQAAAAINHPNVAIVYSVEEAGRQKFITMEYVEGKTLDEFVRPDGISLRVFLDWFVQIADALSHAHHKGIVHRDIKPGNIMITTANLPKVLDFGLAQTIAPIPAGNEISITRPDQIIGTPSYMSPEQARGNDVDERTDIFSLGVVMHEALTGERPFKGENYAEVISELLTRDPDPPADAPAELSDLILRCLAKDPDRRLRSMDDVRKRLESIRMLKFGGSTDGLPLSADKPQPNLRRWVAFGLGSLIVLALLAIGFYRLMPASRQPPALAFGSVAQRRLSQTNHVIFAQVTPDGNSFIYSTAEPGDRRAIWIRRINDSSVLQLVPPSPVSFWGGFTTTRDGSHLYYIHAEHDAAHGTLSRISTLGGTPKKVADTVNDIGGISPDGRRLLYVRYGTNVLLLSANADDGSDERIIRRAEPNEILRDPQYSYDGKYIFCIRVLRRDGNEFWSLEELDLDGNLSRIIVEERRERISEVAVLADGSGLLLNAVDPVSNLTQISHISLPDLTQTRTTNDLNAYFGLSVSADGSKVVTVQRNFYRDIWVGKGQNAASYRKVTTEATAHRRVNWTADGRLVYDAVDNNRPHIRIMNADGSGVQQLTEGPADFEPRVSPDGKQIVFSSERSGERKVWRMDLDGGNMRMLTEIDGTAGAPYIAPDGGNVYFLWTKSDGSSLGVVPITGGPIIEQPRFGESHFAISPDGKQVAYTFYSDAEERHFVAVRPIDGGEPTAVFNIAPTHFLYWPTGGEGLYYRELEPGDERSSTIFVQPVNGSKARPHLSVAPDLIFDFALSPDGKSTAIIRGRLVTDAVLISRDLK